MYECSGIASATGRDDSGLCNIQARNSVLEVVDNHIRLSSAYVIERQAHFRINVLQSPHHGANGLVTPILSLEIGLSLHNGYIKGDFFAKPFNVLGAFIMRVGMLKGLCKLR